MYREYDDLIDAGTDHFSFCYEFEDPEVFARLCPGKAQTLGQKAFFDAMEYTSKKLGAGESSGEIIAGVEPIEATKRGDRPDRERWRVPDGLHLPADGRQRDGVRQPARSRTAMKDVFAYLYERASGPGSRSASLPIQVSLVVQPEEAADLATPSFSNTLYEAKLSAIRALARPYVWWKRKPRAPRNQAGRTGAGEASGAKEA